MKKFILTGLFITLLISLLVTHDNENVTPTKSIEKIEAEQQENNNFAKKKPLLDNKSVSEVFVDH